MMRLKWIPHLASWAFGSILLSSMAFGCYCLNIDLPFHHRHQVLLKPASRRNDVFQARPIVGLKLLSHSDFGDGCNEEQQPAISPRQGQSGHIFSSLRTNVAAFSAGSLFAIVISMISFSFTLSRDYQVTPYQNAGTTRPISPSPTRVSENMDNNDDLRKQKQKAVTLYRIILEQLNERYVDDIEPTMLFETTTRAMLSTLDPYTEYISPDSLLKRQPLVGIGAFVMKAGDTPDSLDGKSVSEILARVPSAIALPNKLLPNQDMQHLQSQSNSGYRVLISLENYAYDAGLRVGDEILEIDDHPVVGDDTAMPTLEAVREMLMGYPGTKVKLAIKRPGTDKVQTIYVERKVVQFPDLPYASILSSHSTETVDVADSHNGIGYIKLQRFGIDAGVSTKRAIESIQSKSGPMKGLILDLRGNSGGELLSAVQIASLFVPECTYLGSSAGKGSLYPNESYISGKLDFKQYGYASHDDFFKSRNDIPSGGDGSNFMDSKQIIDPDETRIVILTNHQTASASEFLAGVFQDLDKGVIIGNDESTLGKGIGQREMGLPYGGGALKLTYHEFYTPSGRCVQRQYPQKKPHQLQKVYYTDKGRAINDRAGIEVDYKVEPRTSLLDSLLSSSGAYFDFATEFCSKHPPDFVVDDQVYSDFKSFVVKEQKRGNLKLEEVFDDQHLLENIQKISGRSNVDDSSLLQRSVENLRGKIVQDLMKDFDTCEGIIRDELEQNILARKLPDSGLIRRKLKSDALVQEAIRLIEDRNQFQGLLGKTT